MVLNSAAVGTNSNTFSILQTPASDNAAQIFVTVNKAGMATSNTVTLTVNPVQASTANVLTFHNDMARTGQNLNETILTPANVNSSNFGLWGICRGALVDAEPLYVSKLSLSAACTTWCSLSRSTIQSTPSTPTHSPSCGMCRCSAPTKPQRQSRLRSGDTEIGVTSTPVIDPNAGSHGVMYLVAMSKDNGNYFHRLHALDITTGAEICGSPTTIQATFPTRRHNDIRSEAI